MTLAEQRQNCSGYLGLREQLRNSVVSQQMVRTSGAVADPRLLEFSSVSSGDSLIENKKRAEQGRVVEAAGPALGGGAARWVSAEKKSASQALNGPLPCVTESTGHNHGSIQGLSLQVSCEDLCPTEKESSWGWE